MLTALMRSIIPHRGGYRASCFFAQHLKSLHCVPISIFDSTVYLDLRLPTSLDWLQNHESWECAERQVMRRFASGVVYDIGANVGIHTALLNKQASYVYAFEPNPVLQTTLKETCRHLENAELVPFALSDSSGVVEFFVPTDHTMGSFRNWTGNSAEKVTCETRRLDDLNLPLPNFIKCDVEGAELQVFRGARETIEKARPIILYEANVHNAEAFGQKLCDATNFLMSLSPQYSFHRINPDGSLKDLKGFDFNHANILALPTGQ